MWKNRNLRSREILSEWSKNISWPNSKLSSCLPVSEGCVNAFNNTNFIRVSRFFNTYQPVFKVVKDGFHNVRGMWFRENAKPTNIARFGENGLREGIRELSINTSCTPRKVVLENYVEGAINILSFSWSSSCILSVGNENLGSSADTLAGADVVVYIPQFGVISSLNVVAATAIALHVRHVSITKFNGLAIMRGGKQRIASTTNDFSSARLARNGDLRPIRPILYGKTDDQIQQFAREKRLADLYVLYENKLDHKNLGQGFLSTFSISPECWVKDPLFHPTIYLML